MADVQNGVKTLLENFNQLSMVHEHYRRQIDDRQTDLREQIPERNVRVKT